MSFKSLASAVSEQCQEMKQALALFSYFETWDENVIAECCRLGSIVEFPPDKIILGSHTGNNHTVYFILEGICQIIHHLHVHVKVDSYGKHTYRLYRPEDSKISNSESAKVGYTSLLFNEKHDFQKNVEVENVVPKVNDTGENEQPTDGRSKITNYVEEVDCSQVDLKENGEDIVVSSKDGFSDLPEIRTDDEHCNHKQEMASENEKNQDEVKTGMEDHEHQEQKENEGENLGKDRKEENLKIGEKAIDDDSNTKLSEGQNSRIANSKSVEETTEKGKVIKQKELVESGKLKTYDPDHHLKVLEECRMKSKRTVQLSEKGPSPEKPSDVKSFFMQIGLLYKRACFGLENNVSDRFIISATRVKCLRIPRRFLLQHNPCNIWKRIQLFLDLYLPREEKILEYFVSNQEWTERKKRDTKRIVRLKNISNYTSTSDVPYSIRLAQSVYSSG